MQLFIPKGLDTVPIIKLKKAQNMPHILILNWPLPLVEKCEYQLEITALSNKGR